MSINISNELIEAMIRQNETNISAMSESRDEHIQRAVAALREQTERMREILAARRAYR